MLKGTLWRRAYSTAKEKVPQNNASLMRQVMRSVAQPVAVITCRLQQGGNEGEVDAHNHGATLSSLSSISLSPPLVSFSLRLPSRLATHLSSSRPAHFSVHLLAATQEHLARAFARQAPLPQPAAPSPSPSPNLDQNATLAMSDFEPELFDDLRTNSLGEMRCRVVRRVDLRTLRGEGRSEEGNGRLDESPRSELFIAQVDEVRLPPLEGKAERSRGSLVYWEQGYKCVKESSR